MKEENIQVLTFEEGVRKWPYLYIGNEGVIGLIYNVIVECIENIQSSQISLEFVISADNEYIIRIKSLNDINFIIQKFNASNTDFKHFCPRILKIVSGKFDIISNEKFEIDMHFSFDKELIINTSIDYLKLSEKMIQIALLNRHCEILTIDKRQKYLIQNYYYFPQGIFYLFDRAILDVLGQPEFVLTFDDKINSNAYQIGLAFRTDWYPSANKVSFANDIQTFCGGSLVDGIIDGLMSACKIFVKENNLVNHKIFKKKVENGLILICSVRGENFNFGGNFKEILEDETVNKEAKKIMEKLVLEFFRNEKHKADKFLCRFDTSQLSSGMY